MINESTQKANSESPLKWTEEIKYVFSRIYPTFAMKRGIDDPSGDGN
ncbi:hypothetical protein [Aerosakkonema funiforme]|uniref:Uncharacterized protein n=1 Tax=Aerosakkonema funiforme FACHB-1375 TaxID=2949571 RepID=A0A926VJC8_9CYAN|nr:hypothetical protein [Aerosakkonema funiforme]MBD2183792.1 hypothetical protein [Aerosakkonema funiforme FACHB-1375]